MPTNTIFMGTPDFAVPSLEALAALPDIEIVCVITQPDRRAGRGKALRPSAVKQRAQALGFAVWTPERLRGDEALATLHDLEAALFVVAAYGEILRPAVLAMPRYGALNVHASLLPRQRGASPVAGVLLAGDAQAGVTIMQMDEGMDTGPILTQRAIAVRADHTRGTLTAALALLGAELLAETVPRWLAGAIKPTPQEGAAATYTRLIRKSEGELDWSESAEQLARTVRAFDPWPGTFTTWEGKRLKILAAQAVGGRSALPPGGVAVRQGELAVATSDGWLRLDRLQLAGKGEQTGAAFLNGYPQIVGARLGMAKSEHE
ncbi:MAG: methionyl-tRNA formyltransferase [Anaerolineales bacterium]|nr:methionyl-tRNA formyltransferase [Anaerolineales bacterium]MCB9126438.1 methionyl-tRNA formyltransferase [Ardenticatenales bacterium]MCB9171597.1 methionyl-tRNA formyltransferase [Ardenticatenales bacterium]